MINYTKFLEDYSQKPIRPDIGKDIKIELIKLIFELKSLRAKRVPYDSITTSIIQLNRSTNVDNHQGFDYLLAYVTNYIKEILEDFNSHVLNNSTLVNNDIKDLENAIVAFYKLIEHTSLAIIQYSSLYAKTESDLEQFRKSIDEANKLKQNMVQLQATMKISESSITKMEDKYSSIYTDFIAILGIFSSFVFIMFGGFDALSSIIGSLSQKDISIVKTLLISSILVAFLITVIYTLILWVAKIIERPFVDKSCECDGRCNELIHIMGRHRFYLTLMFVSFVTAFVSIVMIYIGIE